MPEAIIVDWYGPYHSKGELREAAKDFGANTCVLYMAFRARNVLNYVGMTERPHSRFANHEKLAHPDNKTFYIGEIVTRGVGGRRRFKHRTDHKLAEHALIAHFDPSLNAKLNKRELADCCVVYSRFFSPEDGEEPADVLPKFPRMIGFNSWSVSWD